MSRQSLFVELLAHTPMPETLVASSAKLCYSGADVFDLFEDVKKDSQAAFLQKLVDMGHLSPIEHVSFTFAVQGVSRALLAQVTRHRIASFSVQSQRYVSQTGDEGFSYIIPPSIEALGDDAIKRYDAQMAQIAEWYDQWNKELGVERKEDARFVLPNACETRLIVTMNARELSHFFKIRCCGRAQWEIRAMAWAMLGHALNAAPDLFKAAGPSCVTKGCQEGKMSCGKARDMIEKMQLLRKFIEANSEAEDFSAKLSAFTSENFVN